MESSDVFDLRKEAKNLNGSKKLNKLNEALDIANKLFSDCQLDDCIQKALAWTLIDLCKYYISINNTNQASIYLNKLFSIEFEDEDEIIEKQKIFLRPKIDVNYAEVKQAEEFSKANNHLNAISIIQKLITQNRLNDLHHESYGWIIYRYIKNEEEKLTSVQVRTFLRDYMNLNNDRPSLLHSMILTFALHYSKKHSDFNLYKFFKLWNPVNLSNEDKTKQFYNEREIPSLLSRIFRVFIEQNYDIEIKYLIESVTIDSRDNDKNKQAVLDLLREPFFWQIYNAKKDKNFNSLWKLFDAYNLKFTQFHKSKWHSEALSLAERFMQDSDEWRFLIFFKNWNPSNFMDEDWKEVIKDEKTYKPLSVKCLKKSYNIVKTQTENDDWLIDIYRIATIKLPNDEWIKREKALLLIKNNVLNEAIEIYKTLVLSLSDKSYIWSEFSGCFDNKNDLKIGMLSKALLLEKNEDFLGETHLELAKTLIENDLIANAIVELSAYKKHREKKGWKLSETYTSLNYKISKNQNSLQNNQSLYKKYIPLAEEYAYQDIKWVDFVLVEIWKNDKNKNRYNFSDGQKIEFSIGKQRFKNISNAKIGNILQFKLHKKRIGLDAISAKQELKKIGVRKFVSRHKIKYNYIPLLSKSSEKIDWSILEDEIAVIDYINKDIIHAITSKNEEIFFKADINRYSINDFLKGKKLIKKWKDEKRIELKNIEKIESSIGVKSFEKKIAIVDNVNNEKKLFHYVVDNDIHGIVRFNETDLRPKEGTFLSINIAKKTNKKLDKVIYKALDIKVTNEKNDKLLKSVKGLLTINAGFGFVEDIYVHGHVLRKHSIFFDCEVEALAVYNGNKWNIIKINKV